MGTRSTVKSSGLLVNLNEETLQILINIANLNKQCSRRVKVEVFDWTFNIPTEVPITSSNGSDNIPGDGGPITIKSQTAAVFASDFLDDMLILIYEVRVTFFDSDENVLITSNGLSKINGGNVPGQTVLDADFTTLD